MRSRRQQRAFYLFILPWLIGLLVFQAGPLLASFLIGFTDWQLPAAPRWVGLANYALLLRDPLFPRVLLNTLYYVLVSVPLGLSLAFVLAYLLNNRVRGAVIFRTIFFLPVVITGAAVALLWGWLFNSRYGLINQMLALIGIRGPAWLQDPNWAMPAMILMSLWNIGASMIVYLAALQDLPTELLEAAILSGANTLQRARYVVLPFISPITFYLAVLGVVGSFQVFTPTYILTQGGPGNATMTVALYIYFNAFQWHNIGYASVLSWLLCSAIIAMAAVQFRLARHWVHYAQE